MMKTTQSIILFCALVMCSCSTKMVTMPPNEVKMMTTKQINANKELVFKSVISLLQSESYLIEDVNKDVGLITAYKRIENKNSAAQKFWTGVSKDANTSKASIYIEELNSTLSEVKITLYEGSEKTKVGYFGIEKKENKEGMIYDAQIYSSWFNALEAEIARRNALLGQ